LKTLYACDIVFVDFTHVAQRCARAFRDPAPARGVLVHIQVLTFCRDNGLSMKPFMVELYALTTFLSHNNAWRIIPFGDTF
jgi:hypothetical protein